MKLTGDDAYERYLAHWRAHHSEQSGAPLDRAAFCREEQRRRWDGVGAAAERAISYAGLRTGFGPREPLAAGRPAAQRVSRRALMS